jgi:RND superfamily putative drug exporter
MTSLNLAARIGSWSARHRKTAILGWIAFVALATVLGGQVGQNNLDEAASGSGDAKRGDMIVAAAGFPEQAGEQVLIQGQDPARAAAVKDVVRRLSSIPGVTGIAKPLHSADGRSVLVSFKLPGSEERAARLVEQPLAAVAAAQAAISVVLLYDFVYGFAL